MKELVQDKVENNERRKFIATPHKKIKKMQNWELLPVAMWDTRARSM